jgi:hypothetical protein
MKSASIKTFLAAATMFAVTAPSLAQDAPAPLSPGSIMDVDCTKYQAEAARLRALNIPEHPPFEGYRLDEMNLYYAQERLRDLRREQTRAEIEAYHKEEFPYSAGKTEGKTFEEIAGPVRDSYKKPIANAEQAVNEAARKVNTSTAEYNEQYQRYMANRDVPAKLKAADAAAWDCQQKQMEARGEEGSISAEHDILIFLGMLGQLSEEQQKERLKRKELEKVIERAREKEVSQERRKRAREAIKRSEEKAEQPTHDDTASTIGAIVIESLISEGAGALQRHRSRGSGGTTGSGGGTSGGGGTKPGGGGGCTGGTCRTK